MIYITEMAFPNKSRLADWHAFYLLQIANLQTVPGFLASQRFEAVVDTISTYTTLHEIASPDVFESAIYRQRGGRASNGEWQVEMTNWHRNLYDGLDETPEVANDSYLLFVDEKREIAERDIPLLSGVRMHWLNLVGLDRTIPHRGIAVLRNAEPMLALAERDKRVHVYRPITEKIRQPATVEKFASITTRPMHSAPR